MLPFWYWFSSENVEKVKDKTDELIHGQRREFTWLFWAGLFSVLIIVFKSMFNR